MKRLLQAISVVVINGILMDEVWIIDIWDSLVEKVKKNVLSDFTRKATAESLKKSKRYRGLCYESSNSKVATVTKSGKIKAIKKGTGKIYVYAQNGAYKTITITVKWKSLMKEI